MDNTFLYTLIAILVILLFFLFLYNQYNDLANKIKQEAPAVIINEKVNEKTVIVDEEEKERRKREEIAITGGTTGAGFGLTGDFSSILSPKNVKAPQIITKGASASSFPAIVIRQPGSASNYFPFDSSIVSKLPNIPTALPGSASLAPALPGSASLAPALPGSASLPSDTIQTNIPDGIRNTNQNDAGVGVDPTGSSNTGVGGSGGGNTTSMLAFQDYAPAQLDLPPNITFKEDPEPPSISGLLNEDLSELRKDLNYFFKTSEVSRQRKRGPPLVKPKPEELPTIKHLYRDGSYDDIDGVHVYKTQ